MTNWRAVTESGSVWEYTHDILHIDSKRHGDRYAFKPWHIKVVDRRNIPGDSPKAQWEYIRALPNVEEPVVGLSLYAAGREDWRLSTPIASFEILEDEE